MKNEHRNAVIRQRAIVSVKQQIKAAATTLNHRSVELDQLLRDQEAAEKRAEARRGKFRWTTRSMM